MRLGTVLRRVHMYLGLFLAPWMLMYALSTIVMNHRTFFGPRPGFEKESERTWEGAGQGAPPAEVARRLLSDLDLEGTHTVNAAPGGARITILRFDPFVQRRIVFTPADRKVVVEKQPFRMTAFLEGLHRRRGYQPGMPLQQAWAFSVDVVIAAILFWAASGVWMCWEMKKTRLLGACLGGAGCLVFAYFLFTI